MQSSRASPPPHRATPSPPTDRSHTTQPSIPSSFYSLPPSLPPFFTMNPLTDQRLIESMMPDCPVDHHHVLPTYVHISYPIHPTSPADHRRSFVSQYLPSTSTYQDPVPRQYSASWDVPTLHAAASSEHPSSTSSNPLGMVTPSNEGTVSHAHVTPRSVNNTYSYCGDAGVLDDMFSSDPSTNSAGDCQVLVDGDWVDMHPSVESFTAQDQLQDIQHVDADMFPSTNVAGNSQADVDRVGTMHPSAENPITQDQLQDLQYVPVEAYRVAPSPVIDAFYDDVQQAAAGDPAPGAPAFLNEVPHQGPVPNERASEVLRQLALLYLNDPYSQIVMIRMGPGHGDEVTVDFTLKLTNL